MASDLSTRLTGIYVHELDLSALGVFGPAVDVAREAKTKDMAHAVQARELFEEATRKAAIDADWKESEDVTVQHTVLQTQNADLLLLGAHDSPTGLQSTALNIPGLIIESGCPALVLPGAQLLRPPFRRILIGWNGRKEAKRALHDALPLLRCANLVVVVAVTEDAAPLRSGAASFDAVDHLRRHGIDAEFHHVAGNSRDAGDAILSTAGEIGADLIVAGCYGHARVTEFLLGGTTNTLLRDSKFPLLLSH
jgi:nucleotide-binding universal stress UspA family protein